MYKIIDKDHNIWSCNISDLTVQQANGMLKQWESGATLGSLTLFYDADQARIVLNEDNPDFDSYKKFAIKYASLDADKREHLESRLQSNGLLEACGVLRNGLERIEADADIRRAEHMPFANECELSVIKSILYKYDSVLFAASLIFSYGVMQGKRLERARRKAGGKS